MAYNKSERFQYSHERFRIFDPGAYQYPNTPLIHPNKVPFVSKAPRETTFNKIWTHAVYFPKKQENIPNCTSLQSKVPRFRYDRIEVEKAKAVEEILCDCGSGNNPEKPKDEHEMNEPEICQGKTRRRLFIGPINDYSVKRVAKSPIDVPFYESRTELSAFYQGCKWSRWTSRREMKIPQQGPGPADYNLEQPLDMSKICVEKLRAKRRKTSQQLRFIEIIQRRTLRENHPGPASYSPILPQRKDFRYPTYRKHKASTESKSTDLTKDCPGPADYQIPRKFDVKTRVHIECHAKLPNPAPFGVKGVRFKQRVKTGPGPASYYINNLNLYHKNNWKQCNSAPFGSTSKRFKESLFDDNLTEEIGDPKCNEKPKCILKSDESTWEFRSKTIRMKSPKFTFTCTYKNPIENNNNLRPKKSQYLSPFHSSEGRFRNWYNWIPIHGSVRTPDPARYCTEKPKCTLIVLTGTFGRQRRFVPYGSETPAPNQFVLNGIEKYVLHTHNFKLRKNIKK